MSKRDKIDKDLEIGKVVAKFLLTGVVFICIDGIFLTLTKDKFNEMLVDIQGTKMKVKPVPVALQFLIASLCYNVFIDKKDPIWKAGLLGSCINGIYETTNYAIFDNYRSELAILDTAWGFVLYGGVHKIVNSIL